MNSDQEAIPGTAAPAGSDVSVPRTSVPLGDESSSHDAPTLVCPVCPHACKLTEHKVSICGVRTVRNGAIVSLNYGEATALALDPIEKKPLARFRPGTLILSYGSFGCNLRCRFCQNADISMANASHHPSTHSISPAVLVEKAVALREDGNIGIAYTYNEPLITPEFLVDTATLAREHGLVNVVVTNGYATQDTWERVLPLIDAANIDLKCFSEEGYRSLGAPHGLSVVKRSIEGAHAAGVHVEVTTLVVPGLSDDADLFAQEVEWLASLDPDISLHLSRFFPHYKAFDLHATEVGELEAFAAVARKKLHHVYLGNV